MKIKTIKLTKFRRFEDLTITDLPPARLIILAGPNGSGKSSLFDAFSVYHRVTSSFGLSWDGTNHSRDKSNPNWTGNQVRIDFHAGTNEQKSFYIRSAYRNDPDFQLTRLTRQDDPVKTARISRMIEQDAVVSQNYQRLASEAFVDAFDRHAGSMTLDEFREKAIGEIKQAVLRLFPDLALNNLGDPLADGTFRFTKGAIDGFSYKNLSGGEKAAFDLLLDMIIKRKSFDDTVYAIDEPESHMNTRLQGALLSELYHLVPENSQLWIATHSIGMMRKAQELYRKYPGQVIFLDFEGHDYDSAVSIRPIEPNRDFWERILHVALDDLAELVAPKHIVVCEGNPVTPIGGRNEEHDAKCYNAIFSSEFPDTKFVAGGNSKDVGNDRLKFAAVFPHVIKGVSVQRLIDRDDHSEDEITGLRELGVTVLERRHIESYLYDDEVLTALYSLHGREADIPNLLGKKSEFISDSVGRNNAVDDVKSAAPNLYSFIKHDLGLTACGNDQTSFARSVLVPLIKPGVNVYEELKKTVFVT